VKLERQAILHDKAKNFEFLLTESATRWQLCEPSIMAVQIDRLVSLSQLPNIRIGVLPLSVQVGNGAYHTFVTYDRRLVTIELFTANSCYATPKTSITTGRSLTYSVPTPCGQMTPGVF
jgi:hypothetical protein